MTNLIEVKVPDIGDSADVDVIEILVAEGDTVAIDDPLITLETDKATMEVPSSEAGVVKAIVVKVGDKVSKGDVIIKVAAAEATAASTNEPVELPAAQGAPEADAQAASATSDTTEQTIDLVVPDIGDASNVDVIEVCVAEGDSINANDSLIVLETDKATMEVPASDAGTIQSLSVKVGDKVSKGDKLGSITVQSQAAPKTSASSASETTATSQQDTASAQPDVSEPRKAPVPDYPQQAPRRREGAVIHASPAVRRFARELGVELAKVTGSGPKSRVLKEDVQKYVKYELSRPKATAATGSFAMPEMPEIDFSKWGEVEQQPLSRIQKISSVNLHRNWITIPHVTQHEDADITDLEAFRQQMKDEAMKSGVRLTPLAFVMKALVHTLQAFPRFNSSLANDGENLIVKKYYHIGVAADTPDGLVVPVVRDVDQKSVYQIATELAELSAKARDKKLGADAMQGSTFTISSLGGIGGTAFTPIVAWPNVAILGLSKNQMKPVWNGQEFVPRLMLPMSLSYDHRVIDGADAARFSVHLAQTLADIRRVLL
ncbi:MAG: dihydrolipoyllysine-residue acetyltransferase [Gammaproteobacteria bacterium]|nr:dihydrolipoyllysine-residue acetyltransferase [Gammaproteobacteria bacterium]